VYLFFIIWYSLRNHEKSKKHKEKLALLKELMEEEDEKFDSSASSEGEERLANGREFEAEEDQLEEGEESGERELAGAGKWA